MNICWVTGLAIQGMLSESLMKVSTAHCYTNLKSHIPYSLHAAIKNYCKLCGLQTTKIISHNSEGWDVEDQNASRFRCQMRTHLQVCGQQFFASVLTWHKSKQPPWVSFLRARSPLWAYWLPKSPHTLNVHTHTVLSKHKHLEQNTTNEIFILTQWITFTMTILAL